MSPSPGDALVSCVKKVPTDVMGKDYTQQCFCCGGGASTCRTGQNRRRYTSRNVFISNVEIKTCWPRHVRRAALPQLKAHSFGNKPAPAVKERRSALSRCTLKKLAVTLKGKVSSQNRDHFLLLWPAFNHIRRGGLVSTEKNLT